MRTSFITLCIGALAIACSDGPQADAGAGDAVPVEDVLRDSDAGDAGVPADAREEDAGACGCTYGFHQGCAPSELCMQAYSAAPMCERSEPAGGCAVTSTAGISSPCTAQCVTAEQNTSPCTGMDISSVGQTIEDWFFAINAAVMSREPDGWAGMRQEDIDAARISAGLSAECIDFLGWTVLALVELCRGTDTVRHQEPWERIENRLFKQMRSPEDDCRLITGSECAYILQTGVQAGGEGSTAALDQLPGFCPNGLPYAAPCNGADAQECLKAHVATIIRALYRRP